MRSKIGKKMRSKIGLKNSNFEETFLKDQCLNLRESKTICERY